MVGALTFIVSGHMCCGVSKTDVMFRVGEEAANAALEEPGVRPMDITGRPLKGMVFVDPMAIQDDDEALQSWVARGLEFVQTLPPR